MSGHCELSPLPDFSAPAFSVGRVSGPARFRRLQRPSRRARSGPLRASWVAATPDDGRLCVAYAISTGSGNAVVRNTTRRRLRHAMNILASDFPPGDVLVRVVGPAQKCSWPVVLASVADLGRRLQLNVDVKVLNSLPDPPAAAVDESKLVTRGRDQ